MTIQFEDYNNAFSFLSFAQLHMPNERESQSPGSAAERPGIQPRRQADAELPERQGKCQGAPHRGRAALRAREGPAAAAVNAAAAQFGHQTPERCAPPIAWHGKIWEMHLLTPN